MQGHAALSAILLTLLEGQLPANQLPSRTDELDFVLGNGEEGRRDAALQYREEGWNVKFCLPLQQ